MQNIKRSQDYNAISDKELQGSKKFQPSNSKEKTISICTWNINHTCSLTDQDKFEKKINALKLLLRDTKPDLLVLQEFNNITYKLRDAINNLLGELKDYRCDFGLKMEVDKKNPNNQKNSTQIEYYPLFYLHDKFSLGEIKAISIQNYRLKPNENYDGIKTRSQKEILEQKDKQTGTWTQGRPLVVRELSIKNTITKIHVATVHTSPGAKVSNAVAYVSEMKNFYQNDPFIIAGDWYVEKEQTLKLQGDQPTWEKFLKKNNLKLVLPKPIHKKDIDGKKISGQTNFPNLGEGMIADYFVVSNHFKNERCVVFTGNDPNNLNLFHTENHGDLDSWPSDHVPVLASFDIQVELNLVRQESLFPLSAFDLTYAMSDEPILLNGMKVLFDNPTPTTPVTLQPKQRGTNNGR